MSKDFDIFTTFVKEVDFKNKMLIDSTTHIDVNTTNKFLKILKNGYDKLQDAAGIERFAKMSTTILNAMYTQRMPIISITCKKLREVGKKDRNWKKFTLDHNIYTSFINYLERSGVFRILKPKRQRVAMLVELVNPKLLEFFTKLEIENAKKDSILWLDKKAEFTDAERVSEQVSESEVRSSSRRRRNNENTKSRIINKNISKNSTPFLEKNLNQNSDAHVNITEELFTHIFTELNVKNLSTPEVKLIKDAFYEFFTSMQKGGPDQNGGKKIEDKIKDLLTRTVNYYGPEIIPINSINMAIDFWNQDTGGIFENKIVKTYKNKLKYLYTDAKKIYNHNKRQ
jgi:hypothetical protein